MDTAQARSIYLPKLGGILQVSTIGQPPALTVAPDAPLSEHERLLAEAVRFITGFPAGHVMTYSRWREITETVRDTLSEPSLVDQLRSSIGGGDAKKLAAFDQKLTDVRAQVNEYLERVPDVETYSELIVRNIVLAGGLPH